MTIERFSQPQRFIAALTNVTLVAGALMIPRIVSAQSESGLPSVEPATAQAEYSADSVEERIRDAYANGEVGVEETDADSDEESPEVTQRGVINEGQTASVTKTADGL